MAWTEPFVARSLGNPVRGGRSRMSWTLPIHHAVAAPALITANARAANLERRALPGLIAARVSVERATPRDAKSQMPALRWMRDRRTAGKAGLGDDG